MSVGFELGSWCSRLSAKRTPNSRFRAIPWRSLREASASKLEEVEVWPALKLEVEMASPAPKMEEAELVSSSVVRAPQALGWVLLLSFASLL